MARPNIRWNDAVSQGLIGPFSTQYTRERLDKSLLIQLRVQDEQDHIQSIDWDGLPKGITKSLIERIMYYRGSLCLFYLKANNTFYVLPFVGKGIDCYGRWTKVTPVVWRGKMDDEDRPWIEGLELTPVYDMVDINEWSPEMMDNCCVILNDYTPQYSQTLISRMVLNEPILKMMSELLPFMRTSLANSVGISGINVQSQDESDMVAEASFSSIQAALNGDKWIPLNSALQLSDIKGNAGMGAQEYLMAYQAMDNYRKSTHGIAGGGMMQKGSHMLSDEQAMNADGASLTMQDRVYNRQQFCLIANSIWGTFIWANSSEPASGIDRDMNGILEEDESEDLIDNTNNNGMEEANNVI